MVCKIKVGVIGYGTIGKRVADAVMLQKDMELAGITGHSYNWRMDIAHKKGIKIFNAAEEGNPFAEVGIDVVDGIPELVKQSDIIVDCSPKKIGAENKEKYYLPAKRKAILQGGEKDKLVDTSFVAQCNYSDAVGKNYIRVVSCNTTGLARTLHAINQKYGVEEVHATMIRRGADPWDIRHGPINAIVPVLELPSHHGPDVATVLKGMKIFTTAVSISSTLMHMHNVIVDCKKTPTVEDTIKLFENTTRVRMVDNSSKIRSTAEIMELAKDLGYARGDMPEICIWKEGIGVQGNKLLYMQAIHQESDVVCENIDAIRAAMGFKDGKKSIEMTNRALGLNR